MKMIAGAFFSAYEYAARARSPKTTTLLHPCAHLLECLAQVRLRLASHLRGGVTHAAERSATAALAHLGHDLRPIDEEEERSGFVRHGTCDERLARPCREEQDSSHHTRPPHTNARAHTQHIHTHTCTPQPIHAYHSAQAAQTWRAEEQHAARRLHTEPATGRTTTRTRVSAACHSTARACHSTYVLNSAGCRRGSSIISRICASCRRTPPMSSYLCKHTIVSRASTAHAQRPWRWRRAPYPISSSRSSSSRLIGSPTMTPH
jgi:hypothetical protein